MKKKIIFIIAIIIVVIFFIFLQSRKYDDWNVYENSRYSFSVEYPSNWKLGETEANNAGREIISPKNEAACYVYGFTNALLNDIDEPQTINEFIDWLIIPNLEIELLERKEMYLGEEEGIYLLTEQQEGIREAIYILNNEEGRGLYCFYENESVYKKLGTVFEKMTESFKASNLSGDSVNTNECVDLLNGAIIPLKDLEIFRDTKYTEVTITSREAWDKDKLPKQVIDLESKDYNCYPMPTDFEVSSLENQIMIEPAVTEVEWSCELEYDDWKYLEASNEDEKRQMEEVGFTCEKETCFTNGSIIDDVYAWLCFK